MYNEHCRIYDNVLEINDLSKRKVIPEVINSIKRLHFKFGHRNIKIDVTNIDKIYPFPTIPVRGVIDHFERNLDVQIDLVGEPTYLKKIHFRRPDQVTIENTSQYNNCLDRIWIFKDSDEVHLLVDGFISSIRKAIPCEAGVLDACTWCFNEIMDNIIQHSNQDVGLIMAQLNKETKILNVCIYDYGIGIHNSFRNSVHRPKSPADAISLAISEGVTRDKKIGQGNGMWGLYNIIRLNDGALEILSGRGGLNYRNDNKEMKTYKDIILISSEHHSTMVNFRLDLRKKVSIKEALGGHELVDMFIENLENDFDQIVYKISDQASGYGTRQSGARIRNELVNTYKIAKKQIYVDFDGIGIISSSFADELIGKLIVELGIFQFQSIYRLINMNETIQAIVQRSVSQRMAESLEKN